MKMGKRDIRQVSNILEITILDSINEEARSDTGRSIGELV